MNKIVVFGTKDQLTIIRERLSVSYEVIGCYDLTDDCNGKICSINDIQDNICIFADKKQKRKFNDIFGEIGVESVIFEDFVHTIGLIRSLWLKNIEFHVLRCLNTCILHTYYLYEMDYTRW